MSRAGSRKLEGGRGILHDRLYRSYPALALDSLAELRLVVKRAHLVEFHESLAESVYFIFVDWRRSVTRHVSPDPRNHTVRRGYDVFKDLRCSYRALSPPRMVLGGVVRFAGLVHGDGQSRGKKQ